MSEFYQSRRTSITDSAGFLGFVIGFIGAAPFAWRSLSARWESGDLTSGLLHFLIIILGAAVMAGVVGMGIGSAAGWTWERAHRSRRRVRPDVDEAGRPVRDPAERIAAAKASATAAAAHPDASRSVATPRVIEPPRVVETEAPPPSARGAGVGTGEKTLVIIFGPPAVGKMTVGAALERRTGLRLFHNHMTVEPVLRFFEFASPPFKRLVGEFRTRIFEEVAASALPGMIFTYVWAFDEPSDAQSIDRLAAIFRARGADVFFVELEATQLERLRRNETEFRLAEKASKRDVAASRARLLDNDRQYRLNSRDEFAGKRDYLRIDNTSLSADEVADRIIERFGLRAVASMEAT